ncbi:hypothetical protein PIB30_008191 [Stylosanthes scabra]|uniref:Uncharacterized protein n=1 Tax=Stylosanthes scabra TaxID=79078 RepID=A0ABU6Z2J2_9FABA|nr:hypothetical protein [Stylosanthes scabra]
MVLFPHTSHNNTLNSKILFPDYSVFIRILRTTNMGLEILEEFRPMKSIRTSAPDGGSTGATRTFSHHLADEDEITKEKDVIINDEECHTPTALSNTTLVCPPPPRKRRRLTTTTGFIAPAPPQGFFQVPLDLTSVFLFQRIPPSTFSTTCVTATKDEPALS